MSDCLRAVPQSNNPSFEYRYLPVSFAPRPRLERGTYCLGGIPEAPPKVARHGLTCCLAVLAAAGCGQTWPTDSGRWLPVRLPEISCTAVVRIIASRDDSLPARFKPTDSRCTWNCVSPGPDKANIGMSLPPRIVEHLSVSSVSTGRRTAVACFPRRACRPRCVRRGRMGGRITALAGASVLLASRDDNTGIGDYVKPRNAATCDDP